MSIIVEQRTRQSDLSESIRMLDESTSKPVVTHTEASLRERYSLGRVLGYGASSTVHLAIDRSTGKRWACKVVTEEAERDLLLREVHILQQLDHPNLLHYREHFSTPDNLYIITELLEGPDLVAVRLKYGSCSESDARSVMRQMLSALSYLDALGVAHRDLKMENIVLTTVSDSIRVKILDFGLADQLSDSKSFFDEACGTPSYLAPEVVSLVPYGTSCDVWAAGVVLYTLLSGDYPFQGGSVEEVLSEVRQARVTFRDPVWEMTSSSARHLVMLLLTPNPVLRVSAEEALEHPWLGSASQLC